MSIFGGGGQGPTRINGVQINQSVQGYPVPVVMGKGRVQQTIVWLDGFISKQVSTGGKGFGGGKGNQDVYSADAIGVLCAGPITGIADVWSGQSWLSNNNGLEQYTITTGGLEYTPQNAGALTADQGVGSRVAYSGDFDDAGGAQSQLRGTHIVPFARKPYGASLDSGEYSVTPANGYAFSPADIGVTVQISYSFDLSVVKQQVRALIPAGLTVAVGSSATGDGATPYSADAGVVYYSTGGNSPNNGLPLTPGGSGATGTYSVSGTQPAIYTFAAGDVGQEVVISYYINNTNAIPQNTSKTLAFTLYNGAKGQQPCALLDSNFPGAAFGYTGVAYVVYSPMDLGYGAQIQQNTFEVLTDDAWGGGVVDCNPVKCILRVLTDSVWGLGAGASPFPTSAIDNGPGGTWGDASPPGFRAVTPDGTAASWFAANGFFITPVIDRQDSAASLMSRWLEAGQCAAFMSEGKLKLVPYGDTSTAGNGAVWEAPSQLAFDLDDTDFVTREEGVDPVALSSSPWPDAYNVVQVQWDNRANQYAPEITPAFDQSAINRYGSRIEDPQTWDFITTLTAATFAGTMRVRRNVYTRNTYEFALSYRYARLEPMDVGYITTSSGWASAGSNTLGIVKLPVRITKIVDNPDGTLNITAEDRPYGVHQPSQYPKATAAGSIQPNRYADPGATQAVIFEASNRLSNYRGNELWIGATGAGASWGGCNVLVATDGDTYKQVASIQSSARLGALAAALPATADPDTTDALVVNLVTSSGPLESATVADADLLNTLCYVGGEVIAYSACALTGPDQYTASGYIRRGQMGTAVAAHPVGAVFLRLDEAVIKYTYDPIYAGKTISFKFQSINTFGNAAQDWSQIQAIPYTVPGDNPGAIDASTGAVLTIGTLGGAVSDGNVLNLGGVSADIILQALRDKDILPPEEQQ